MAPGPTAPRPRHVWTRSSRRYNPLPKLPATIAISCSCCEVLQVSPVTHSTMLVLVVVLLLLLLYYYHYCSTTTTTQTYIEVYTPIAGYSPGGNVVEHNEVTLDQKP